MADIVLATLNARYIHASFGLRYLHANLDELESRATILEFVINDNCVDMLAQILQESPKIVGFGVYIWNVDQTTRLISELKLVRPEIIVVIGGPEVSYELEGQPIVELADYIITGEADLAFRDLCRQLLVDEKPTNKIINASVPNLAEIKLPYHRYSDDDIANRVLYVELSRGCPFTCEFCLSSLDIPVRSFDLNAFLNELDRLLDRGAMHFKFVDRTFNLNLRLSKSILQFFLDRYKTGMFIHFELVPDRLPEGLRELIRQFPEGVLQFEIGIQTLNMDVEQLISRRQNQTLMEQNFRYLRSETGVHIHADLIVGLPGESLQSFAQGFDRLLELNPQEIQVGILKRLRGTPITQHDDEWQMIYSSHPPYEILSNRLISFEDIHRMRRFAKHWDMIANSGNFMNTFSLICEPNKSAFEQFMHLSEWLFESNRKMHGISLIRLNQLVLEYLTQVRAIEFEVVAKSIYEDYCVRGNREVPGFLKHPHVQLQSAIASKSNSELSNLPARQRKRLDKQK
jgi:radical SAM superfamily enzyme YgiQ (UPF0313 family)